MRIISGKYKSIKIEAPKNLPSRPTTDMAKSGIFNIITNNWEFDNLSILDLFSGTGNVSYEFASRGCTNITSIDQNNNCVRFIKSFVAKHNMEGVKVIKADVFNFIEKYDTQAKIIFADPPYALDRIKEIPDLVFKHAILDPNGWLIVETDDHTNFENHDYYSTHRKYGNSIFWIFTWTAKEN